MRHTRSFAELCSLRLKKLSHVDVDATTLHAGMKSVIASTKTSHPLLVDQSLEGLLRPCCKNLTKKDKDDGTMLSNPLTLPTHSRRAWTIINNLTGHSRHPPRQCPISANAIASQLIRNGKYKTRDREATRLEREETWELWKIPTPNGSSLTREFSSAEFADALQKPKPGKAPGPDQICPELILHAGPIIKSWLRKFLSSCLCQLRIPKVWKRSLVLAIPKLNKPMNDAKSYRPISLLCIPYQVLEKLIYTRIEPVIDPLLPREQAGFRRGRSTVDQVSLMTQEIEDCFSA